MAQQDGLINVDTFNFNLKAINRQIIGAFTLIVARDSQHLANQIVKLGYSILLQFPIPPLGSEYHPTFGYHHTCHPLFYSTPIQLIPI